MPTLNLVKSQRILVAEDDPASLKLVEYYLESQGYEVEAALDGNRALDLGGSGHFDLLILDIHMPLYEGVEVLQMLRKRFLNHPIKVIAMTADPRSELHDELIREGIDGYMTKPIDLELLGSEVSRLLAPSP
jgi:two-component system, NarL family, sensor histidine kinase BarA